jgi:GT2 family glycosyltransferase
MSEGGRQRIAALVLTHNAPSALQRCLSAVRDQTQAPDEVLVVDNASHPPVDPTALPTGVGSLRVARSEVNGGPAGGWATALRDFLDSDCTHAWLMDDDIVPEPTCLATLWDAVRESPTSAFVFPISIQPDGSIGRWGSWCGFLISREIVEKVGLPLEALFWWAEDTEYCHWRIPQAGFPRDIVEEAVVHHDAIRQGGDIPPWKYYYESRNSLYHHLHIMHRMGRYPRNFAGLVLRAVVRQKKDRVKCLAAICRGFYDGAFGRLGVRYRVSPLHERDLSTADATRS